MEVLPISVSFSFPFDFFKVMATASQSADAVSVSKSRTTVTICLLLGVVFTIIFAAWAVRRIHPLIAGPPSLERPRIHEDRPQKGIARSILESIPVVRYSTGSQLNRPSRSEDLERHDSIRDTSSMRQGLALANEGQTKCVGGMPEVAAEVDDGKRGEPEGHCRAREHELTTLSKPNGSLENQRSATGDDQVDCPVCTEAFLRSDNIRVLPCGHIYHQHCIDPWLLEFAGTCPLWYAVTHRQHP